MLNPVARLPAGTTLFCGAGASRGSGLPDGQALASSAFEHVWAGTRVYSPSAAYAVRQALEWPAGGEPALRLELILDLMAKEVPASTLAGVYSVMRTARPCVAHYALAAAGFPVVTTNQDELVEEAARQLGTSVDVLHVHGLASDPQSIMTMLSQYVRGLPGGIARLLQDRVHGGHLLVLGYSGRDLDVMPYLYAAGRVTWLHFQPGAGPSPAFEVLQLQSALGSRMRVIETPDPLSWLLTRLPPATRAAVRTAASTPSTVGPAPTVLPAAALEAFRRVPVVQRRLAVARVLLHIDQAESAREGLARAARSHPRHAGIQLMLGNCSVQLRRRRSAVGHYGRALALATDPAVRASALLNSAHTRANGSEYTMALRELDRARAEASTVSDRRQRQHLEAWISSSQARIFAMTDQEAAALRVYRHTAKLAERVRDLDLRVSAVVFGSDIVRSWGRYRQALADLECVFDDNELYGRPYIRVWGRFYRGMALCASGDLTSGLVDLETCRTAARTSGNEQAVAWACLVLASYRRCTDLDAAQHALDDCEAAIRNYGGAMIICDVRLAWERAELSRARGDDDTALQQVARLRRRLADPSFPVRLPYMTAHILALEGEVARSRRDPQARDLLEQARAIFAARKWCHGAARMEVSLWLLSGRAKPPARLLRRCGDAGFTAEVRRLTSPGPDYYPLHTL